MVDSIGEAVGLSSSKKTKMHVCIHGDNAGALVLAQTISKVDKERGIHLL